MHYKLPLSKEGNAAAHGNKRESAPAAALLPPAGIAAIAVVRADDTHPQVQSTQNQTAVSAPAEGPAPGTHQDLELP